MPAEPRAGVGGIGTSHHPGPGTPDHAVFRRNARIPLLHQTPQISVKAAKQRSTNVLDRSRIVAALLHEVGQGSTEESNTYRQKAGREGDGTSAKGAPMNSSRALNRFRILPVAFALIFNVLIGPTLPLSGADRW